MRPVNKIRLLFLAIALTGLTATATAQATHKIVGNEIVKIAPTKAKGKAQKTELTYKVKDVTYPVWKSARGKYFIIRTSKKSGNQYNQYLKIN